MKYEDNRVLVVKVRTYEKNWNYYEPPYKTKTYVKNFNILEYVSELWGTNAQLTLRQLFNERIILQASPYTMNYNKI